MYVPFFGLKREPFSIAPDPHFLFMSEAHREALAHLLYGLSGGGGFVLLTGEIGAGKTTVCRCFLDQVPGQCDVAYVFNPKLSVVELLQTVCDEFSVSVPPGARSIKDYVDPLNRFLLAGHAAGRHSVLVIDEAQSLSAEVLEQLRLLTNLETAERKLLQIVLIGQPELRELLAQPELEQLAQRVTARFHLPALSEAETALYVRHRLAVAGGSGELPFDERALRRIHQLCRGVPRRINVLCDRALLGGYASGRTRIGIDIVEQAAREVFGRRSPAPPPRSTRGAQVLLAAVAVLALAGVMLWLSRPHPDVRRAAPAALAGASRPAARPAAASAPAPAASTPQPSADPLAQAWRSEAAAWQALAAGWGLQLSADERDPCGVAQRQRLECYRSNSGLAEVRELGRPGLLVLHDAQDRPAWALLIGLGAQTATLQLRDGPHTMPLPALADLWRGEFATLWRRPPGYGASGRGDPGGALALWVARQLPPPAGAASAAALPLARRIAAFQVAQGLKPDGVAGPMTLMQLNRARGVDEPRLQP